VESFYPELYALRVANPTTLDDSDGEDNVAQGRLARNFLCRSRIPSRSKSAILSSVGEGSWSKRPAASQEACHVKGTWEKDDNQSWRPLVIPAISQSAELCGKIEVGSSRHNEAKFDADCAEREVN